MTAARFHPLEFQELPEDEMQKRAASFSEHMSRRRTVREFSRRELPEGGAAVHNGDTVRVGAHGLVLLIGFERARQRQRLDRQVSSASGQKQFLERRRGREGSRHQMFRRLRCRQRR